MKCTKSMLVTGAVMLAALAAAYFALPQFHAFILSVGPSLLFLLCPLSMLFMMKGMNSPGDHPASSNDSDKQRLPPGESNLER